MQPFLTRQLLQVAGLATSVTAGAISGAPPAGAPSAPPPDPTTTGAGSSSPSFGSWGSFRGEKQGGLLLVPGVDYVGLLVLLLSLAAVAVYAAYHALAKRRATARWGSQLSVYTFHCLSILELCG
jgi:hypothetical protein